jgi:hypothetical protein
MDFIFQEKAAFSAEENQVRSLRKVTRKSFETAYIARKFLEHTRIFTDQVEEATSWYEIRYKLGTFSRPADIHLRLMKTKLIQLFLLFGLSFHLAVATVPSEGPVESPLDRIEFSVYPNPTSGVFYLKIDSQPTSTYRVKVIDLIGKPLVEKTISANEDARFDLSGAPKGIYFVQITGGSGDRKNQIIQRVVIQ